jgi:uroporphyrinogen-III synthase
LAKTKTIVITSDLISGHELKDTLGQNELNIIVDPCIGIGEPPSFLALDWGIEKLVACFFSHVILTSQHAVRGLFNRMVHLGVPADISSTRVIAVGIKTAQLIEDLFSIKAFLPTDPHGAHRMMDEIKLESSHRIFFPKGNRSLNIVASSLAAKNIYCHEAIAYETIAVSPTLSYLENDVHGLCFFNPYALRSFFATFYERGFKKNRLDKTIIGCLGKTTASIAYDYHLKNVVISPRPDKKILIDIVVNPLHSAGMALDKSKQR